MLELVDCQGHLVNGGNNYGEFLCDIYLENMKKIDPTKKTIDVVIFDEDLNIQLGGKLLKFNCTKLIVMRGVGHTVSFFKIIFLKCQFLTK